MLKLLLLERLLKLLLLLLLATVVSLLRLPLNSHICRIQPTTRRTRPCETLPILSTLSVSACALRRWRRRRAIPWLLLSRMLLLLLHLILHGGKV